MKKITNKNFGFTLLETIIAVGIIVVGLTSALALLSSSVSAVTIVRERIAAANLVQEGVEVTRNIRDNNWLNNRSWNQGLADGSYQASWDATSLSPCGGSCNPLLFDSTNVLYNYTTGNPSPYTRTITLTNIPPISPATSTIDLKVEVSVTWTNRGRPLSVQAEDHLFNWK